jgi:hypothetical protein
LDENLKVAPAKPCLRQLLQHGVDQERVVEGGALAGRFPGDGLQPRGASVRTGTT